MMSSYRVFSPIESFCVDWLQERFVVTAFISHSLDGKLRQQFKALYQRIVGAVTAVDQVLVEILETGKEKVAE